MASLYTYQITFVGEFILDDCHASVYAVPDGTVELAWDDFPPDGMDPDGMGFANHDAAVELVLDQTVLLKNDWPGGTSIIGDDGVFALNTWDDFVYQDSTRTFYATVFNSLYPNQGLGLADAVSPRTLERVKQAYYLPVDPRAPANAGRARALGSNLSPPSPQVSGAPPIPGSAAGPRGSPTRATAILSANGEPVGNASLPSQAPSRVTTMLAPGRFGGTRVRASVPARVTSSRITAATRQALDPSVVVQLSNGQIDYLYWTFHELYHPYVCMLISDLYRGGPDALFTRQVEVDKTYDYFVGQYDPTQQILRPYPIDDITFDRSNGYAIYNWEIFFHVPLFIATRLMQNQDFENAQKWFHYIFNPTDASHASVPRKYWITRPFYEHTASDYNNQQIEHLLQLISENSSDPNLVNEIRQWRENPFNPHLIARLRTVAYQKTTVMKYLDNLIAWGDMLFRQDTIESINEATLMYILAAEILGPQPDVVTPRATVGAETYDSIESSLDDFSIALVTVENLVPPIQQILPKPKPKPPLPLPQLLYFCCPQNDKLLGYWGTVADRLFKIRHCLNIEGVYQQLPLFEPPIDPALLVAATAAGIDLSSALADLNAPPPLYRFSVLLEKANAFCADVKSLGSALLSALEKSDAEQIALLRSTNEISLLQAMRNVKQSQVAEAAQTLDSLNKSQAVIQLRHDYYANLPQFIDSESSQLSAIGTARDLEEAQMWVAIVSAILYLLPDFKIGLPTTVGLTEGGTNIGAAASSAVQAIGHATAMLQAGASASGAYAGYARRFTDWQFQANLANAELDQIKSQILAAQIRQQIAQTELDNQDLQITNAQAVDDLMHTKFTNQELYDWMIGQLSSIYFQAYQLAYDIAKRAEAAYRFELGITDANFFITFGYWDSLRQGLLAGDRLSFALRQLELTYLENHRREYEITKHVSLLLLDPLQLVSFRENGTCLIDLQEWLFDLDFPGHYMRRLKSVSLTIPCVTGPYTSVNCTLTLASSQVRLNTQLAGGDYLRTGVNDSRFKDNFVSVQSIATSTGRDDSGMFELNFRDERYLPFESAGAISTWMLVMPPDRNAFDFETISDVVIRLNYTARDGGSGFAGTVSQAIPAVPQDFLVRLLSAARDFPTDWYRFAHPSDPNATTFTLQLTLGPGQFPFLYRNRIAAITDLMLLVRPAEGQDPNNFTGDVFNLTAPDGTTGGLTLAAPDPTNPLPFADLKLGSTQAFGAWTFTTDVDPSTIADVLILMRYSLS
jgi:hypothetical protein